MSKFHKGKFNPKHPEKYKGDPSNIIYRSQWEKDFMGWLDSKSYVVAWNSEEFSIPYISPVDGLKHRYFPDFLLQLRTKIGIETWIVEIKPFKQTHLPKKPKRQTQRYLKEVETFAVNDAKWEAATQFCKENNIKWKVLTEKDLYSLK